MITTPGRRLLTLPVVLAIAAALVAPRGASAAAPATFSGTCAISGPIVPMPPVTVVPRPGPHFSYRGRGACWGSLAGRARAAPAKLRFRRVSTLFDTCELGPDFNLPGRLRIGAHRRARRFDVIVNLARIALVGPFSLTTEHGGNALGLAQFTPPDNATAVQQCLGSGIAHPSLSTRFSTMSPLVGVR